MRTPTPEQRTVLNAHKADRLRVVRSVPGSGKTWLVAEVIDQELSGWTNTSAGFAALSFTRVGGEEIRKALGRELGHPHYIGTLDSFLFRYVLRPYWHKVFPGWANPRVASGEWGLESTGRYGKNVSHTVGKINVFGCVFIGEENGLGLLGYKPHPKSPLVLLTGDELRSVKEEKKKIWKKSGILTHSDAACLASYFLNHEKHGEVIREELIRRFPFLIVDELQDTGYFLGKSIRALLTVPASRALLVGDPDQAIFEFSGAKPALFRQFENLPDAVVLPLSTTWRCSPGVSKVASHLMESAGMISPNEARSGRVYLVRYAKLREDVVTLIEALRRQGQGGKAKVIARATVTVEALNDQVAIDAPNLHCPALTHSYRSIYRFRRGESVAALNCMRAALDRTVFGYEAVSEEALSRIEVTARGWKRCAVNCVLRLYGLDTSLNFYDWQSLAGMIIDSEIASIGVDQRAVPALKPKRCKGWDTVTLDLLPAQQDETAILAQTVHSVKGETHPLTIFVVPPTSPKSSNSCPSVAWWSNDENNKEEKRIAYVAMTRTAGHLIICVHETSFARLSEGRSAFLAACECFTINEFVERINEFFVNDARKA
jgi:DNA helicase II / ATP-dependent DNA helicase PcrA